ncbi:hypothetical protein ABW20_dc0107780 [Dactylellina cionopaga]|nr:hypothetical protein ABW20_dc0107780 [Dactylellina cionopaga]
MDGPSPATPTRRVRGRSRSSSLESQRSSRRSGGSKLRIEGDIGKDYFQLLHLSKSHQIPEKSIVDKGHRRLKEKLQANISSQIDPYVKHIIKSQIRDLDNARRFFTQPDAEGAFQDWYYQKFVHKTPDRPYDFSEYESRELFKETGQKRRHRNRRPTSRNTISKQELFKRLKNSPRNPKQNNDSDISVAEIVTSRHTFSHGVSFDESSNEEEEPKLSKDKITTKEGDSDTERPITTIPQWVDAQMDKNRERRVKATKAAMIKGPGVFPKDEVENLEETLESLRKIPWKYYANTKYGEVEAEESYRQQRKRKGETNKEFVQRLVLMANPYLKQKHPEYVKEWNGDEEDVEVEGYDIPNIPLDGATPSKLASREISLEDELGVDFTKGQVPTDFPTTPQYWWKPMQRSWLWRFFFGKDERMYDARPENMNLPKRYRFRGETFKIDNNFEHVHVCTRGETLFEHLYFSNKHFIWPDHLPKPPGLSARDRWLLKIEERQALLEKENQIKAAAQARQRPTKAEEQQAHNHKVKQPVEREPTSSRQEFVGGQSELMDNDSTQNLEPGVAENLEDITGQEEPETW